MCTTLGIFDLSLNLLISATPCSPMMDDCIRVCNSHIIKGGPYQVFTQLMYTCTECCWLAALCCPDGEYTIMRVAHSHYDELMLDMYTGMAQSGDNDA